MAKPRLLIVSPSTELYGADRVLLSVLPTLADSYDVTVAVPGPGDLVAELDGLDIDVVELPDYAIRSRHLRPSALPGWAWRIATSCRALTRLHRRQRFDLVYSGTLASGIGTLLAPLWRVPHVQHIHEVPYHGALRRQALLRWTRLTSKRVVFNSHFAAEATIQAVPGLAEGATVVRNGIVRHEPIAHPNGLGDTPTDRPLRVVCAARFNHWKGHAVLAEAMHLAATSGSRWDLHLFGDALPEDLHIAEAFRGQLDTLGLSSSATFHGFVDDQDVIYETADVIVVPSTLPETFGLTALEAHARGIPVVATRPGGTTEVIEDGETGFLVPAGDPGALAAALVKLEDPELRASMGAKALHRARREFPVEATSSGLVDVLDATLAHR